MAKQNENFLPSSSFLRIILSEDYTRLKLAPKFLERYGNTLSKEACLKVVDSTVTWKMEIKRSQGRVWLCKGWKEFAEYYSIKFGHMLMFEYEGDSRFSVSIFGVDTMEIQYPVEAAASDHNKGKAKVGEMEQEEISVNGHDDGDDDDDDNYDDEEEEEEDTETREKGSSSKGSSKKARQQTKNERLKNPNLCFEVKMQYSHVMNNGKPNLYIPQAHASKYLFGQAKGLIYLIAQDGDMDGDLFECKYHIEGSKKRRRVSVGSWRRFVQANRLKVDDICVFELVNTDSMHYQVSINRA